MHRFLIDSETKTDVLFVCQDCKALLGFNKPGFGTPSAVPLGLSWQLPDDAERYCSPCPGPSSPAA